MRTVMRTYFTLWTLTAVGALTATAGLRLLSVGAPHDALQPTWGTVASLLAHNTIVALWPLALVAIGWHAHRLTSLVTGVLVAGQLILHGLLVGNALGQAPTLWRYLPHLPFEWLGIAVPAAGWQLARTRALDGEALARLAVGATAALVVAAYLETWTVPL